MTKDDLELLMTHLPKCWPYPVYHTQFRQNQDKSQSLLHAKSLYQFSYVPVLVLETESYYMTQVDLKLMSLLLRSPKYWDYRHEPSYLT